MDSYWAGLYSAGARERTAVRVYDLCFLGCLFSVLPAVAQAQSAAGTDAWAIEQGDAVRGERLFRQHCVACHRADDLAKAVFPLEEAGSNRLCGFLQTHGATDDARDCDLIAYLSRTALEHSNKIEKSGR